MPSSLAYSSSFNENAHSLNNHTSPMDDGRPKNEDVFLNIARTDSARRDSLDRWDLKRVSEDT